MAPWKPAALRPAVSGLRRSARLQKQEAPAANLLGPVVAPGHRVTKPIVATKPKKSTRHDCTTCGRNLSTRSFPKRITANCDHSVTTCKACLKTWIATQLDTTTYDKISCPECPQIIQNTDVKEHALKRVYDRFDELERRGIAEEVPGWRWCLAPGCRAGQVHQSLLDIFPGRAAKVKKGKTRKKDDPEEDICECHECGAKACVPCDRPYHTGETCAQYQKRLKDFEKHERATLKTIEKECKKCPSCNKNIQKFAGCDYMHCTQCGTAFCFRCLTTYLTINKRGHAKGCIYAQPNAIDPHGQRIVGGGLNAGANNRGAVGRFFRGMVGVRR